MRIAPVKFVCAVRRNAPIT